MVACPVLTDAMSAPQMFSLLLDETFSQDSVGVWTECTSQSFVSFDVSVEPHRKRLNMSLEKSRV